MITWRRIPLPKQIAAQMQTMSAYQANVVDGHLSVFAGPEDGLWHLSISHRDNNRQPGRYPTWDEISDARYRFVPDYVTMAMFLPPRDEYINLHNTTFHLWQVAQAENGR